MCIPILTSWTTSFWESAIVSTVPSHKTSANLEDAVPQLYQLAAVLLVQFVTVHPFSDGNGRLARSAASHVLREVTPFYMTPYADGTASTRSVFIQAITAAGGTDQMGFLELGPPDASMGEAGWEAWRIHLARKLK